VDLADRSHQVGAVTAFVRHRQPRFLVIRAWKGRSASAYRRPAVAFLNVERLMERRRFVGVMECSAWPTMGTFPDLLLSVFQVRINLHAFK
jgi:hypothetical protein